MLNFKLMLIFCNDCKINFNKIPVSPAKYIFLCVPLTIHPPHNELSRSKNDLPDQC